MLVWHQVLVAVTVTYNFMLTECESKGAARHPSHHAKSRAPRMLLPKPLQISPQAKEEGGVTQDCDNEINVAQIERTSISSAIDGNKTRLRGDKTIIANSGAGIF
jgi:hypothetical protein